VKTALCGSLEHPNVMQAEDVSEQLTTMRDYFKISRAGKKKLLRLALKAEKLEFSITHAAEQDLFYLEKETIEMEHKSTCSNLFS
jgi:exonuclease SbcC